MALTPAQRISANIRAELARRQLRQQDLANALGMAQSGVSKRLAGSVPFDVEELARVAEFLDLPLADLVAETSAA